MEFLASLVSVSQGFFPSADMLNAFIPPLVGLVGAALAFVLTTMNAKQATVEVDARD
jgi:hypothetical protein